MLTRRQRWRRVRRCRFVEPCSSASPSGDLPAVCLAGQKHQQPHPINSISIGGSLRHLLGSSTTGGGSSEATHERDPAAAAAAAAAAPSAKKACSGKVHFDRQVRVVLVPCRTDIGRLKGDIWWGEDDYLGFRREYILAVRAKMAERGDEDAPPSCADDTAATTTTEAPTAESEPKDGFPETVSARAECDDYNVCAPRNQCHESAPSTAHVDPSRPFPPVEAPPTLTSSVSPPTVTEAPITPTAETSLRGERIVDREDGVEVARQPTQPPRLPSYSSSSSSSSSCASPYSCSRSISMVRAAEMLLEGAAESSSKHCTEQGTAGETDEDAARYDEEDMEGFRTQSMSSVSDHTDVESDSDTDEDEDRPKQEDSGVRKNIERPPRPPRFRRELPVQSFPPRSHRGRA